MTRAEQIESDFRQLFEKSHRTILLSRNEDPEYLPADASSAYHRIFYHNNYWRSALHELAHWTIAGSVRLKEKDYGYWYTADRGSTEIQQQFLEVELRPQAVEWHLTAAFGEEFFVSLDSFSSDQNILHKFRDDLAREALSLHRVGLPKRAQKLINYWLSSNNTEGYYSAHWTKVRRGEIFAG